MPNAQKITSVYKMAILENQIGRNFQSHISKYDDGHEENSEESLPRMEEHFQEILKEQLEKAQKRDH